jgi:hypothetical protein
MRIEKKMIFRIKFFPSFTGDKDIFTARGTMQEAQQQHLLFRQYYTKDPRTHCGILSHLVFAPRQRGQQTCKKTELRNRGILPGRGIKYWQKKCLTGLRLKSVAAQGAGRQEPGPEP